LKNVAEECFGWTEKSDSPRLNTQQCNMTLRSVHDARCFIICHYNILLSSVVVTQYYEAEVVSEYVIRGNAAILKCTIPSFVAEFVSVESWVGSDNSTFKASTDYGIIYTDYGIIYTHSQRALILYRFLPTIICSWKGWYAGKTKKFLNFIFFLTFIAFIYFRDKGLFALI